MNEKSRFGGNQEIPREIKDEGGESRRNDNNDGIEFRFGGKVFYVNDVATDMRDGLSVGHSKFKPDWWVGGFHEEDDKIPFKPKHFNDREEENEEGETVTVSNLFPTNFHFSDNKEERQQEYADYGLPAVIQETIEASIEKAKELKK